MRTKAAGPLAHAAPPSSLHHRKDSNTMAKPETSSPEGTSIAVREAETLAKLEAALRSDNPLDMPEIVTDPGEVARQMRIRLLDAETDEELEETGEAQGWGELSGVPIRISGFRFLPSDANPDTFYFVVFGERLDDGENVVLTTGSDSVMATLINLAKRGKIPGAVRILTIADKPTKSGFYPHKLVSTPEERERRKAERVAAREGATS